MAILAGQGAPLQLQFPVFDVDGITPVTGLVDGDFGRYLAVDGTASAVVATVTEITLGRYYIQFTPNADGLWYVEVTTPEEDVFTFEVQVGPLPADIVDDIADAVWSEPLPGAYPAGSAGSPTASTMAWWPSCAAPRGRSHDASRRTPGAPSRWSRTCRSPRR